MGAVRAQSEIDAYRKNNWVSYRDSWITGKQTFQHGYTQEELKSTLAAQGFKVARFLNRWTAVAEKSKDPDGDPTVCRLEQL